VLLTCMTGLVETIWLFVRGEESVRVIRASTPERRARLLIYGPGNTHATHEFQDGIACAERESQIEQELIADGFTLAQFTDRRGGLDRRGMPRGSDRRQE
jgi:hypothetical protein